MALFQPYAGNEGPDQHDQIAQSDPGLHCLLTKPVDSRVYRRTEVCVEVLRPSQPNGVMSSAVSLPNHTFTGQA